MKPPAGRLDLTLVLPCYNEAPHLEGSLAEIRTVLDASRLDWEVVFVDDESRDGTREVIDRLVAADPARLRRIFHEENRGRGAAVSTGVRAARGDVVGFIDVDLEVHPRYMLSCVASIHAGADVAVGLRVYKFQPSATARFLLSKGYVTLVRGLLDYPHRDTETGYKFFRRDRAAELLAEVESPGWFFDTEVMVRAHRKGWRIEEIPCLFVRRPDKKSTVRPLWDSLRAFRCLVDFRRRHPAPAGLRAPLDAAASETYWRREGERFEEARARSGIVGRFLRDRLDRFWRLLGPAAGLRVLDAGCGADEILGRLLDGGARAAGFDLSAGMLDRMRGRLGARAARLPLWRGDAGRVAVRSGAFDAVVSLGLLDYVPSPSEVVAEFARALRPGGRLVATAPKRPSPFTPIRLGPGARLRARLFDLPPILNAFTRDEVEGLLAAAGLRLVEAEHVWHAMWIFAAVKEKAPAAVGPEGDAPRREAARRLRLRYAVTPFAHVYHALRWAITPFEEMERALPRAGTIVDVGCGEGVMANYLALSSPARAVVGLDLDEARLATARAAAAGIPNVRFERRDARALRGEGWSGAVLSDVLHHLPEADHEGVLRAVHDNLAPGGTAVIKEPARGRSLRFAMTAVADGFLYPKDRVSFRRAEELQRLLERAGFSVERRDASRRFGSSILFTCRKAVAGAR